MNARKTGIDRRTFLGGTAALTTSAAGVSSALALSPRAANAAAMPRAAVTLGNEIFLNDAWHDLRGRSVPCRARPSRSATRSS